MTLLQLFEDAYPDPDAFATAEQFARAQHDDIAGLSDEDLYAERVKAGTRWVWTPPERRSRWLLERRDRLEREAARRQQRAQRKT